MLVGIDSFTGKNSMARLPRLQAAGWPHLVVQRVHEGQLLARDDQDRQALLDCLREAARTHGVAIHAYTLAADHLLLLATPAGEDGLSLMMQALGRRYVAIYNRRYGRQGGLWASRFRATVVDPQLHLLNSMLLIESHALRDGSVARVDDDCWSSARHHLGLRTDPLISDHKLFWTLGNTPFEREAAWRARLQDGLSAQVLQSMLQAMHKGWALLPEQTIERLQSSLGRRLTPRPRGRPRKRAVTS